MRPADERAIDPVADDVAVRAQRGHVNPAHPPRAPSLADLKAFIVQLEPPDRTAVDIEVESDQHQRDRNRHDRSLPPLGSRRQGRRDGSEQKERSGQRQGLDPGRVGRAIEHDLAWWQSRQRGSSRYAQRVGAGKRAHLGAAVCIGRRERPR